MDTLRILTTVNSFPNWQKSGLQVRPGNAFLCPWYSQNLYVCTGLGTDILLLLCLQLHCWALSAMHSFTPSLPTQEGGEADAQGSNNRSPGWSPEHPAAPKNNNWFSFLLRSIHKAHFSGCPSHAARKPLTLLQVPGLTNNPTLLRECHLDHLSFSDCPVPHTGKWQLPISLLLSLTEWFIFDEKEASETFSSRRNTRYSGGSQCVLIWQ